MMTMTVLCQVPVSKNVNMTTDFFHDDVIVGALMGIVRKPFIMILYLY